MNRQQLLCFVAIALATLSVCAGHDGRKLLQGGCNNPGCVCEGKPDGNYPLEFKVPGVSYVVCKGGKSGPAHCPGDVEFDREKRACAGGVAGIEQVKEIPGVTAPKTDTPKTGVPQGVPGQGVPQGVPGQGVPQGVPGQGVPQGVPGEGVPQGGPRQGYEGVGYEGYYPYRRQGYEDATATALEEEYNPSKSGFGDIGSFKACMVKPTGRGVGTIPDGCGSGQYKSGLLCYPNCRAGYTGVGPVCWGTCAADSTDIGAICSRPAIIGANCNCPWYDKCGLTFARGCCTCPPGTNFAGCTCNRADTSYAKPSYGNGAGMPMSCTGGKSMDAGLCYPPCPPNTKGTGPMCWLDGTQKAPANYPTKCDVGASVNAYFADTPATCQQIATALNKVAIAQGTSAGTCILAIIVALAGGIAAPAAAVGCATAISTATMSGIPDYQKLTAIPAC